MMARLHTIDTSSIHSSVMYMYMYIIIIMQLVNIRKYVQVQEKDV